MINLAAMQADDALLTDIGRGTITFDTAPTDDQLATFLVRWRAEIHAYPIPDLVTLADARAVILTAAEAAVADRPERSNLMLHVLAAWLLGMAAIIGVIVWFAR